MVATAVPGSRQRIERAERDGYPVVLVVDNDASCRQALASGLVQEGFVVEMAGDPHEALQLFPRVRPDLVLLDVGPSDQAGCELYHQMPFLKSVPIIMVTARDSEMDIVRGLEQGASDYVSKPFRQRELVARMRAVLRRTTIVTERYESVFHVGPVRLNADRREVTLHDLPIELCRKEFDLLALLISRSGQVVTRHTCIDRVWGGQDLADTRTLDTHIKRLRNKIEPDLANPRHLVTVRGVGYRFEA
jgi:two-component system, OmpR family, response regulator RegX3